MNGPSPALLAAVLLAGLAPIQLVTAGVNNSLRAAPVDAFADLEPIEQQQHGPRRPRDHPVQAPTIPHRIDGFPVTREVNLCLTCHGPDVAVASSAPAVAVSHFQDRAGSYLMNVSPRRYFCTQCHVPQAIDR